MSVMPIVSCEHVQGTEAASVDGDVHNQVSSHHQGGHQLQLSQACGITIANNLVNQHAAEPQVGNPSAPLPTEFWLDSWARDNPRTTLSLAIATFLIAAAPVIYKTFGK